MLPLIIDVTNPTQNGILANFNSPGAGLEQDFVRGDKVLALYHRPVVPSITNTRPWDDDWLATDTFQIGVGNIDDPPAAGSWPLGVLAAPIASLSATNPTQITCSSVHNLATGNMAAIVGNIGTTPSVNGIFPVTVIDTVTFSIPVDVSVYGSGGNVYDVTGLETLAYNITGAALTALLSAISVKHGYPACTAVLLQAGDYQVTWATAAAVAALYSPSENLLTPASGVTVITLVAGDSDSRASQLLVLKQSLVAYSQPATPMPVADIVATITRAGDATHNKVYALTMTDGTYGGSFTLTVTAKTGSAEGLGVVNYNISADDFATLLATQSVIDSTDNVSVTRVGDVLNVEFIGTQGLSNVPVIAVTNVDLLAPQGVTGTINFNTFNLYRYFAEPTTGETGTFTFAIRRTRATGEEAEYFIHDVILKRNLLDPTSLGPVDLPSYYTTAQSDARYLRVTNNLSDVGTVATARSNLLAAKSGANADITSLTGTATNDSAGAGIIGQIISSLVAVGSPVSLTTATGANITSISLTAGDWDVMGNVNFSATGATTTAQAAGVTSTSATIPTDGSEVNSGLQTTTTSYVDGIAIPRKRVSLASTTTVYLVAKATFSAGTVGGFGGITARRVR